jgi:hypothetical protein
MALNRDKANLPNRQQQTEAAWHIHAALQRYKAATPEAAINPFFIEAEQEAAAAYAFAMGAE